MRGAMKIGAAALWIGLAALPGQAMAQTAPEATPRELIEAARETAKATRDTADHVRVLPDQLHQILSKLDKLEDKLDKVENAIKAQNSRRR